MQRSPVHSASEEGSRSTISFESRFVDNRRLGILFFQKRKLLIWKTNSTKYMNLISCTVPSLYFLNASHIVICKDLDWHRDVFVWCRHKANPCKIRLNPRQRPQFCNRESRCKSSPSSTFNIATGSQISQIHKKHSLIPARLLLLEAKLCRTHNSSEKLANVTSKAELVSSRTLFLPK